MDFILKSLTKRHVELLTIIMKDALAQHEAAETDAPVVGGAAGGGSYRGMGMEVRGRERRERDADRILSDASTCS